MNATDLSRPHVYVPGSSRTLLLLHGTGADEHDLLRLGVALDDNAALLSPRGMVSENGMNRFFERRSDGSFVKESIVQSVNELASFLAAASTEYQYPSQLFATGFSNGANTALALLVSKPELISGVIAFGSTKPFMETPKVDLTGKRVWIANGEQDPYAPEAITERWVAELQGMGASVSWLRHPGGHQISPAHIQQIARELA